MSYYNQGSHCACEWCNADLDHLIEADDDHVLVLADIMLAEAEEQEDPP